MKQEGDRIYCRLPELGREHWFNKRDALGFWVWWNGKRCPIYERRGNQVQVEIEINGIGKNTWVNNREVKPLSFEENLEFAAVVMRRCRKATRVQVPAVL